MEGDQSQLLAESDSASAIGTRNKKPEASSRVLFSAILTLTLSILGSSVLPIPYAFSRLGVLCGLVAQLIVAVCNAVASLLLLDIASKVGHSSYEGVAEAVGGKGWKMLTQVSLIALLFGTMVGDFALLGDVGNQAVSSLYDKPPPWLDPEGRVVMVILALGILPICCLRRMRSLEVAGTVGLAVIAAVMGILIYQSVSAGLPAIANGELPLWKLQMTRELPEAMSVMGFAFYVAPMLLPLRSEIVAGPAGDRLTKRATVVVIVIVAQVVYGSLGIFGAARHGLGTAGNILANRWLPARPQGALDVVIAMYLGISIPPISLSLRYTLDCLVAGEGAPFSPRRHYLETVLPILASLAIALTCPQASEKIFAITGATAVMLICYLIPVALHLMLRNKELRQMRANGLEGDPHPLLPLLGILAELETQCQGPAVRVAKVSLLVLGSSGRLRQSGTFNLARCKHYWHPTSLYCTYRTLKPHVAADLLLPAQGRESESGRKRSASIAYGVVMPVLVASVGIGCSVAALAVAVSSALQSKH